MRRSCDDQEPHSSHSAQGRRRKPSWRFRGVPDGRPGNLALDVQAGRWGKSLALTTQHGILHLASAFRRHFFLRPVAHPRFICGRTFLIGKSSTQAPSRHSTECKADIQKLKSPSHSLRFHDLWHHSVTELAESQASGRRVYRKKVLGSVGRYADEAAARCAVTVFLAEITMLIAVDHPKDFFLTTIGFGMALIFVASRIQLARSRGLRSRQSSNGYFGGKALNILSTAFSSFFVSFSGFSTSVSVPTPRQMSFLVRASKGPELASPPHKARPCGRRALPNPH
jgi:hypothetical protein